MKNYLAGLLFILCGVLSCKKVDDSSVFGKTTDQRVTEKLAEYQAKLSAATDGWKALVYTKTGGIYTFYFKFNDSNRVQMLSSFDTSSAVNLRESSYRIKALQQPSLLFDTYSYLHVLADPTGAVNGGADGEGLVSDFEFYFDDNASTNDVITLVGRFNGSKAVLTRATPQEATAFATGQLAQGLQISKILTYYKRIIINGTDSVDINVDPLTAVVSRVDNAGNLLNPALQTSYYLTLGGIGLVDPVLVGNVSATEISNMSYDATNKVINATINGTPVVIKEVVQPIIVDLAAPQRWWDEAIAADDYYFSINGFHDNGVEDAYNVNALKAGANLFYYFYLYWPGYNASYDFFGPIFLNTTTNSLSLVYGTAPRKPVFTTDGKAIFTQLTNLGTHPTFGAAATSRAKLYSSSGYYFVQVAEKKYDMVSAADGKTWMRWER